MSPVTAESPHLTVALIGNPNTGKSTLFNALCGVRQRVGNYPGVTVEKKIGFCTHHGQRFQIVDLPGDGAGLSDDHFGAFTRTDREAIAGQAPGGRPDRAEPTVRRRDAQAAAEIPAEP